MQHKFTQTNRQTFTKTVFSCMLFLLTFLIVFALLLGSQVTTEAAKMYWAELTFGMGGIHRSELDGGSPDILLPILLLTQCIGVDATRGKIYWADNGAGIIYWSNLDGTNIEYFVTPEQGLGAPYGIAVDADGGKIYWTDLYFENPKIQRANLDGTNIEDIVTGLDLPGPIAVDATRGKIYWADDGTRIIQRANLDGTHVEDIIDVDATTGLGVLELLDLDGITMDGVSGKIYWSESTIGKIWRANLDGTNIEEIVTGLSGPEGVTVDATRGKIYWVEYMGPGEGYKIQRANLDGTNVEDIVTETSALGIAVDAIGEKIYWTGASSNDTIWRANLDGTNVENLFTSLYFPEGIAVDSIEGKIYWADFGGEPVTIQRANLDGSNIEGLVPGVKYPNDIAVDAMEGKIYWTDSGADKIQRANLDGTNVEDIVTQGLVSPGSIAVDAMEGKIYWVDWDTGKIQRANLDGTNVEDIIMGLDAPYGIAVDASGGKIYWTDLTTGKIQRANLDGTNIEDIVTGLVDPYNIAVDAGSGKIYWTDLTTGKIQRANLDGTNIEDILVRTPGYLVSIALDFATTAGTVTLVDENPPLTWNYHLIHNSGAIEQWTYTGATITDASVDGEAAAAGWSVQSQTDTQVVFATTTALTSGELTGFHITGTTGGTGTWTAGSNSESLDGPLPVELSTSTGTITDDGILLRWCTISEVNNLGFHLYRSETKDGDYARVTPTLIKGSGTYSTPHEYSFLDETAQTGKSYWYVIEAVDFAGNTERCDPIQVMFLPQSQVRSLMPVETRLLQNYPNPFNPETWIPFQLAQDADVTIYIYDIHGQIIRTIKLGNLKAGYYDNRHQAACWDGRSNTGETVSSGLYFYLLTAENFAAIRKMVIMK